MLIAYNQDLQSQLDYLEKILKQNEIISEILKRTPNLQMPNWYLGAGCLSQTVWNWQHNFELTHGIKDYDLVYFDDHNISFEQEDFYIQKGKELFRDISASIEIKNQARVHLWHKQRFGYEIKPYKSVEDAINSWPTTATSVAVRYSEEGKFLVYAPYGLNDLLGMIVRANKTKITKEIYLEKVERWQKIWPKFQIIPWD